MSHSAAKINVEVRGHRYLFLVSHGEKWDRRELMLIRDDFRTVLLRIRVPMARRRVVLWGARRGDIVLGVVSGETLARQWPLHYETVVRHRDDRDAYWVMRRLW